MRFAMSIAWLDLLLFAAQLEEIGGVSTCASLDNAEHAHNLQSKISK